MSIKRIAREAKDGKAQYSYRVAWRDPSGVQKYKTFRTKKEAEAFEAEIIRAKNRGLYVDPHAGKQLFSDYAAKWIEAKVLSAKPSAMTTYRQHVKHHILPTFGNMPLAKITRSEVQDWVNLKSKDLKPRTVVSIYGVLRQILRRAVIDEMLGKSPCTSIELPKAERETKEPISPADLNRIAQAIELRYHAFVIVAAGTGMRFSELAGLTVDRVDFLRKTIRVDRQLEREVQGHGFTSPKTKASIRTIPVHQSVIEAISAHLARFGKGEDDVIFSAEGGKKLRYSNFRRRIWVPAVGQVAGLPSKTGIHALRHSYASILIEGGEQPKVIQERLGHASIVETMNTYGHLFPSSAERTRAVLGSKLVFTPRGDEMCTTKDAEEAA